MNNMTPLQKEIEAFEEFVNRLTNEQEDFHTGECRGHFHDRACPTIKMKRHFSIFLRQSLIRFTRSVIEQAMPEEKEQLDKNDPDNYGACYAIGGFNDCRIKFKENVERILKDNEKEV